MDSPNSSSSQPQLGAVEDEKAASSCSLPTSARNTTSPSRTPLSTVAVQAEFHKYRTHVEKSSFQAQKEPDSCPPSNVPFVTCVPAPLVAALLASPASAAGADAHEPADQHQQPRFTARSAEQRQQPQVDQHQQPSFSSRAAEQRQQQPSFARRPVEQPSIASRSVYQQHQPGKSIEPHQQSTIINRSVQQHQLCLSSRAVDQHQQPDIPSRPLELHQQPGIAIRSLEQHQQPSTASRLAEQPSMASRSDNGSEEDSNPRSEESRNYVHACVPSEATRLILNEGKERDLFGRRTDETPSGATQRLWQERHVVSAPGDNAPELSLLSRQPGSPQLSNASACINVDNAIGGPVGLKRSECVLDITPVQRPPPSRLHDTQGTEGYADRISLRTAASKPPRDPSPTQRQPSPSRQNAASSSTLSDKGKVGAVVGYADGISVRTASSNPARDPSPTQKLPPRQNATSSSTFGDNGNLGAAGGYADVISVRTASSNPARDPSPTQRLPPRQNATSSSTIGDKGNLGALQLNEARPKSLRESPSRDTLPGSVPQPTVPSLGVPQPPPPPPTSPGKPVFKDPACDPDNPFILKFQDVTSAAFMIRNAITITPCVHSRLSRVAGMEVYLKKDFMQLTGSFKERGARYALLMLTQEQRAAGIVAASLGNHALALACHGAQLGIPVTVVMPLGAPLSKESACRAYGANVIIEGDNMTESRNIALALAHRKGLTYINGYDHPHILAGQGTLGLELLEQVCDVDAIIIPVGGGGLLAGVSRAAKTLYPKIKIIAVESENCPSFSAAQAAGKPVLIESQATIADGLAVPMVGVNAFASAASLVDRTVVVNEDLIALSILRMVEVEKNVVEGAGAAGVAAMLSGQMDDLKGKRVVILACGGNIDVSMLGRCLERGLAADSRLFSFTVFVDQNPSSLTQLFCLVARLGASIKHMTHDRKWESEHFFDFPVKIVVETPGASTSRELRTALSQTYKKIIFHHNFEPITSHQPMYPDFPNLDCGGGGSERTWRRDANSPIVPGLAAHHPPHNPLSLSSSPSVTANRDPSPSPSAN